MKAIMGSVNDRDVSMLVEMVGSDNTVSNNGSSHSPKQVLGDARARDR